MTSGGDVLAVLGLFERIAVELRSYKCAPAHFQNLSVELDLVQGTIRQVLSLNPQDGAERDTLERIRAIALHCQPTLHAFADKMRAKESSLGGMRTGKSLSSIGKRLHWSMIEAKDINELRQTVLAEMGAVTILLSASQMKSIHHVTSQIGEATTTSALLQQRCEAIGEETSSIAQMVARTPKAIAELQTMSKGHRDLTLIQGDNLSQGMGRLQVKVDELANNMSGETSVICQCMDSIQDGVASLYQAVVIIKGMLRLLATYSAQLLAALSRNTVMLLNIANQLKIIARAIEAIPLHLTLPVVRLDDALGVSWALPFQACSTYESFYDILKCVVFANDRNGLTRVVNNQFSISLSKVGTKLTRDNWASTARAGMHIEQAIIVSRSSQAVTAAKRCPYPGCDGILVASTFHNSRTGQECPSCGRWSSTQPKVGSLIDMGAARPLLQPEPPMAATPPRRRPKKDDGPYLPSFDFREEVEWLDFRRIEVAVIHTVKDADEARSILKTDPTNTSAHTLLGLINLQMAEDIIAAMGTGLRYHNRVPLGSARDWALKEARIHLLTALNWPELFAAGALDPKTVSLQPLENAERWYLLGRLDLMEGAIGDAYAALQRAVLSGLRSTTAWTTIGVLYYNHYQYQDSRDALAWVNHLSPCLPEPWYNLFILYMRFNNQFDDAYDALARFFELLPLERLNDFQTARQLLSKKKWIEPEVKAEFREMLQIELQLRPDDVAHPIDVRGPNFDPREFFKHTEIPQMRQTQRPRFVSEGADEADWETEDESDY